MTCGAKDYGRVKGGAKDCGRVKGGGVTCEEGADAAEVEGEAEALRFAAAADQADGLVRS